MRLYLDNIIIEKTNEFAGFPSPLIIVLPGEPEALTTTKGLFSVTIRRVAIIVSPPYLM